MKNNHKKVLNWVNSKRKELGFKPLSALPKGIKDDTDSCPIARSFSSKDISAYVTDDMTIQREVSVPKAVHAFIDKLNPDTRLGSISDLLNDKIIDNSYFTLPNYVKDFIEKFDKGEYPDLIEE